jgi:hypothetical protein
MFSGSNVPSHRNGPRALSAHDVQSQTSYITPANYSSNRKVGESTRQDAKSARPARAQNTFSYRDILPAWLRLHRPHSAPPTTADMDAPRPVRQASSRERFLLPAQSKVMDGLGDAVEKITSYGRWRRRRPSSNAAHGSATDAGSGTGVAGIPVEDDALGKTGVATPTLLSMIT